MAGSTPQWAGDGSAMSVTGASTSYTSGGQRGDWGRYGYGSSAGAGSGSMSITGASSSYSGGGQRGNWGDDDHGDHDGGGWGGDDD